MLFALHKLEEQKTSPNSKGAFMEANLPWQKSTFDGCQHRNKNMLKPWNI